MKGFYPNVIAQRADQISPELLQKLGVKGLILDIDNTLTTHDNPVPDSQIAQWLEQNRKAGIKMIVLSNNKSSRVAPFAKILGLDFIANGSKPLKSGYCRCAEALGLSCEELCMVGDQLFTDVWGANRAGCKSILVIPIQLEKMWFFKVKRFLERKVMKKCPADVIRLDQGRKN